MSQDSSRDTFAHHRENPQISVDEHIRRRSIELGSWVVERERVYLDKCFWVDLRDVVIGRKADPVLSELLDGLRRGVRENRRICPISESIFLELLKQSDQKTRLATAELIDELSTGVTLIPQQQRVATEISHMLHATTTDELWPLEVLVWSRLSCVLGVQYPLATAFPPEEQLVIAKAFFDHMWEISLKEVIQTIGDHMPIDLSRSLFADCLNSSNAEHSAAIGTFPQLYKDEIHGCLELAAPIALEVMLELARKKFGETVVLSSDEREKRITEIYSAMCAAIEKPSTKRALRTLHIGALCYAAIRWNKTQRLDANDLYDFQHAEAALGAAMCS